MGERKDFFDAFFGGGYTGGMEIKEFTEDQKHAFRELGVTGVYLFGSQADGTATPESDVDFGIVFSDLSVLEKKGFMNVYGEIFHVLRQIVPSSYLKKRRESGAHEFDIVFLQQAPPRIGFRSAMNGKVLYQSSSKATADFREKMMLQYFDFKHFEDIFNQSFLALPKNL